MLLSQVHSTLPVCDTVALSVDRLLPVTCIQLDSVVGGTSSENTGWWLQSEINGCIRAHFLINLFYWQLDLKKQNTKSDIQKNIQIFGSHIEPGQ